MNRSLALLLASMLTLPGIPSLAQGLAEESHREPMTSKMAVETPVERLFPLSSPVPVGTRISKTTGPSAWMSQPFQRRKPSPSLSPSTSTNDSRSTNDSGAVARGAHSSKTTSNNDSIANKPVAPGLVEWRQDFATACNLSERSGKPVLLFQMMGKLDDEFC
jgi:hypothetical protein